MIDYIKLKFSIIIPVYNRIDYIRKAVDSCLMQEYSKENIEIIVVKNILNKDLEEWLTQRSVLFINSKKVSLADKLIEGIKISNGDIICLLEDDDEFVYDKIKTLNEYYKKFPSVACIHNNFRYKEETGYKVNKFYLKHIKKLKNIIFLKQEREKLSLIKHKDIYHNLSCWSFRRDSGFALLRDMVGLTYELDFLLYVEVVEQQKEMVILPEKLTIYRRHNSASRMAVNEQKMISFFELSIFSLESIEKKLSNERLKNFIKSNIYLDKFKANVIDEESVKIIDIKYSLQIIFYPPYIKRELYPFLFLYLPLGLFSQFRKDFYLNHAYISS